MYERMGCPELPIQLLMQTGLQNYLYATLVLSWYCISTNFVLPWYYLVCMYKYI